MAKNEDLALFCLHSMSPSVHGNTPKDIYWLKDWNILREDAHVLIESTAIWPLLASALVIVSIGDADLGEYQCLTTNGQGLSIKVSGYTGNNIHV